MTHHGRCCSFLGDGIRIDIQISGVAGRNVGLVALAVVVRHVVVKVGVEAGKFVGLRAAVGVDVRDDVGVVGVADQDGRDQEEEEGGEGNVDDDEAEEGARQGQEGRYWCSAGGAPRGCLFGLVGRMCGSVGLVGLRIGGSW